MLVYDDVDEDVLLCYHEMTLANLIFHTLKEGACSEQSSRMTAMDGASKNAGTLAISSCACAVSFLSPPPFVFIFLSWLKAFIETGFHFSFPGDMISKLTLTYNRTRQAVITRELIEIISGAAAV